MKKTMSTYRAEVAESIRDVVWSRNPLYMGDSRWINVAAARKQIGIALRVGAIGYMQRIALLDFVNGK